jgi:hypothetical protein
MGMELDKLMWWLGWVSYVLHEGTAICSESRLNVPWSHSPPPIASKSPSEKGRSPVTTKRKRLLCLQLNELTETITFS